MDNLHYVSWALNAFLLLLGYLMRTTIEESKRRMTDLEVDVRDLTHSITDVKVNYLHKGDFSEFKQELWAKLDDLKDTLSAGR